MARKCIFKLVAFCLRWLRERYGAWQRCCMSEPGDGRRHGARAERASDLVDAARIASLDGYERLSSATRASVAWHTGLPEAVLVDAAADVAAASSAACAAARAAAALRVGEEVRVVGLRSRPDLNGTVAKLLAWDAERQRWACRVQGGGVAESLRIREDNLEPVPAPIERAILQ